MRTQKSSSSSDARGAGGEGRGADAVAAWADARPRAGRRPCHDASGSGRREHARSLELDVLSCGLCMKT
eukprot:4251341-Prymnesium_polylepis.1